MCAAGITLWVTGVRAARNELAETRSLEKLVVLANVCVAVPLAVFGALHLFGPAFVRDLVPAYMPWRSLWVYAVGVGLLAASVSIAVRIGVHWSGLLFGLMMFLFVAMIHFPGALRQPHNRIIWVIVCREMSFGGAGWMLAGLAADGWSERGRRMLITVGRVPVTLALIVFGIQHFLHPTGLPGVPLAKQLPAWIPWRVLIDYVTGAALLVAGGSVLTGRKTRTVASGVGSWIVLLVFVTYGPVLVAALSDPRTATQVEGINYFADTLLFAGVILTLARTTPAAPRRSPAPPP